MELLVILLAACSVTAFLAAGMEGVAMMIERRVAAKEEAKCRRLQK